MNWIMSPGNIINYGGLDGGWFCNGDGNKCKLNCSLCLYYCVVDCPPIPPDDVDL